VGFTHPDPKKSKYQIPNAKSSSKFKIPNLRKEQTGNLKRGWNVIPAPLYTTFARSTLLSVSLASPIKGEGKNTGLPRITGTIPVNVFECLKQLLQKVAIFVSQLTTMSVNAYTSLNGDTLQPTRQKQIKVIQTGHVRS
jgi:hypothetical protein